MGTAATRRAALVWIGAFPAAASLASKAQGSPAAVDTSEWDSALERYLAAREAAKSDLKHGALRRAYDEHEALPEDAPKEASDRMFAAEEVHFERFTVPQEAAAHALLLTAAPTMLALRQKVWVAQNEDMAVAGEDHRPILSVIGDDISRLTERVA